MKNYTLHIPEGVKDFLCEEASAKQMIEERVKKVLVRHGYDLIETPTFEYLDVFTLGDEAFQNPRLYKWINKQGEVVALCSDQTKSIARVVATQNSMQPFPQRYAYVSNSFRYPEQYQGKMHEFTQAGIEIIGNQSIQSDAEVIMLAIEAIKATGITEFTMHIGSAAFLGDMLSSVGISAEMKQEVYKAIDAKDAVRIKEILEGIDVAGEVAGVILHLMQRVGKIDLLQEIKEKIHSEYAKDALVQLEALYAKLVEYGVEEYILFDFSILSYASYYTGMMFQGYTHGVGSAIVEGGRYDKLLEDFGKDLPAVGMGINVNLILQKYQALGLTAHQNRRTLFVWEEGMGKVAIDLAKDMRSSGLVIEYGLGHVFEEEVAYAKAKGIQGIIYFAQSEEVVMYDLEKDVKHVTTIEELCS